MTDDFARILRSIWRDQDWKALTRDEQWAYEMLCSQTNMTKSGLIPLLPEKWAGLATKTTPEDIMEMLHGLAAARFIGFDLTTHEVLVRTLIRNDGILKKPPVFKSALRSAQTIEADHLRAMMLAELLRIPADFVARMRVPDKHESVWDLYVATVTALGGEPPPRPGDDHRDDRPRAERRPPATPSVSYGASSAATPDGPTDVPQRNDTGHIAAHDAGHVAAHDARMMPAYSGAYTVGGGGGGGVVTPPVTQDKTSSLLVPDRCATADDEPDEEPPAPPPPPPPPAPPPPPPRPDVEAVCERLAARVAENTGKRPNITKTWRRDAELLLDRDLGHEPNAQRLVEAVMDWACADPFWSTNVLGMPKFRKQFDQLRLKRRLEHDRQNGQHRGGGGHSGDEKRRQVRELIAARYGDIPGYTTSTPPAGPQQTQLRIINGGPE